MGFNTVVLVLNDYMHELIKSPHTVAWAICHPPHSIKDLEEYWWPQIASVARDHNEDYTCLRTGLKVLPTFHADDNHVLLAGWNGLLRPNYDDVKVNKDRTKLTVNLPEWWRRLSLKKG